MESDTEGGAGTGGSSPARVGVRTRRPTDLPQCALALAEVHRQDGYPVNWPEDAAGWLGEVSEYGAWVALLDGRTVGHIGLGAADEDLAAAGLWADRPAGGHPQRGTAPHPQRGTDRPAVSGGGAAGGEGPQLAVVSRLFVAPDARGHALGALLVERAVARARELGLQPLLDVVATDTAACALYERLGWELLGTVHRRWGPEQRVTLRCYAAPAPAG